MIEEGKETGKKKRQTYEDMTRVVRRLGEDMVQCHNAKPAND